MAYDPRMVRFPSLEAAADCAQLAPGYLVYCEVHTASFGIICVAGGSRYVALLSDNAVNGAPGPFIVKFEGPGVSFGNDFSIGFDPASISMGRTPQLGEILILNEKLWLVCHRASSAQTFGGKWMVCMDDGEARGSVPDGHVIQHWSIAVASGHDKSSHTVFERVPRASV